MAVYNNGACEKCSKINCEYLTPVHYTDDEEPYYLLECIDPNGKGYWFEECPKGLSEYTRNKNR